MLREWPRASNYASLLNVQVPTESRPDDVGLGGSFS